jgi:arsenate reductase
MAIPSDSKKISPAAVRIYHNPRCSKSRQALELIRSAGIEPEIVRYLETPPSREELKALVAEMGGAAADLVREGEKVYKELGLSTADDKALLDAMAANPILINRPVVATARGTRLCRPPEAVLEILPTPSASKTAARK